MAFADTTTIYPDVSDTRTGAPTTIYPYTMSASDRPRGYARSTYIRTRGSSRETYANTASEEILQAGGYLAWLDKLELASPSTQSAIRGGTFEENRRARRQAQAAYDQLAGVVAADDAQVSVSDDDSGGVTGDLGATLDSIGDVTVSVVERAKANPGATVAIVGGAILLFLLARRR